MAAGDRITARDITLPTVASFGGVRALAADDDYLYALYSPGGGTWQIRCVRQDTGARVTARDTSAATQGTGIATGIAVNAAGTIAWIHHDESSAQVLAYNLPAWTRRTADDFNLPALANVRHRQQFALAPDGAGVVEGTVWTDPPTNTIAGPFIQRFSAAKAQTHLINPTNNDAGAAIEGNFYYTRGTPGIKVYNLSDLTEATAQDITLNMPPAALANSPALAVSDNIAWLGGATNTFGAGATIYAFELTSVPAVPNPMAQNWGRGIRVTWPTVARAATYQVEWRQGTSGNWTTATTTGLFYNVGSLTANQLYQFRVQARNAAGNSAYSTIVTATPTTYGNRNPGDDYTFPNNWNIRGIGGTPSTFYVVDDTETDENFRAFAYPGFIRAAASDIPINDTVLANPTGITTIGPVLWGSSSTLTTAIRAYRTNNGALDGANVIITVITAGWTYLTSRGGGTGQIWAVDPANTILRCWNTSNGLRNAGLDIDLHADNANPTGIWTDGTIMYVVDSTDEKVYAYNIASKARETLLEFDLTGAVGTNGLLTGIWGIGNEVWVGRRNDGQSDDIQSYFLTPPAVPPTGLALQSIRFDTIRATWNSVAGATYRLRYRPQGTTAWFNITGITALTQDIAGLTTGTTYEVQVASVVGTAASTWSASVTGMPARIPGPGDGVHTNGTPPAGFIPPFPPAGCSDLYEFWDAGAVHTGTGSVFPHPQSVSWALPVEFYRVIRDRTEADAEVHYQGWIDNIAVSDVRDHRAANLQFRAWGLDPDNMTEGVGNDLSVPTSGNAERAVGGFAVQSNVRGLIVNDTMGFAGTSPTLQPQDGRGDLYVRDGIEASLRPAYPAFANTTAGTYRLGTSLQAGAVTGIVNIVRLINGGPTLTLFSRPGFEGTGASENPPGFLTTNAQYPLIVRVRVKRRITVTTYAVTAPTNLSATLLAGDTVRLAWQHPTETTFELRYRPQGTTAWTTINNINAKQFDVVLADGRWEFQVRVSGGNTSAWSTIVVFDAFRLFYFRPGASEWGVINRTTGATSSRTTPTGLTWRANVVAAYRSSEDRVYVLLNDNANVAFGPLNIAANTFTPLASSVRPAIMRNRAASPYAVLMAWVGDNLFVVDNNNVLYRCTPAAAWTQTRITPTTGFSLPTGESPYALQNVGGGLQLVTSFTGSTGNPSALVTYDVSPIDGLLSNRRTWGLSQRTDNASPLTAGAIAWIADKIYAPLNLTVGRWLILDTDTGNSSIVQTFSNPTEYVLAGVQYGGHPPTRWFVFIDYDSNARSQVLTDETERVLAIRAKYGRGSTAFDAPVPGLLAQIQLNNQDARYNQFRTLPRGRVRVQLRHLGVTHDVLRGRQKRLTDTINQETTQRVANMVLNGPLESLNYEEWTTNRVLEEDIATGALVTDILNGANWPSNLRVIDAGHARMKPFLFNPAVGRSLQTPLNILRQIEQAEYGLLHEDRGINIHFESRYHRYFDSRPGNTIATIGGANGIRLLNITPDDAWAQIYNNFDVPASSRNPLGERRLWEFTGRYQIPAGETATITVNLLTQTPNLASENVRYTTTWAQPALTGSSSIIAFEDSSNTAITSVGFDTTSDIRLTAVSQNNFEYRLRIQNTRTSPVFLTRLEMHGNGVSRIGDLNFQSQNQQSIMRYGQQTFSLPSNFIGDALQYEGNEHAEVQEYVNFLTQIHGEPVPRAIVEFDPFQSDAVTSMWLRARISDPIAVTGNIDPAIPDGDYHIESAEIEIIGPSEHRVRWGISRRGTRAVTVGGLSNVARAPTTNTWTNLYQFTVPGALTPGQIYLVHFKASLTSPDQTEQDSMVRVAIGSGEPLIAWRPRYLPATSGSLGCVVKADPLDVINIQARQLGGDTPQFQGAELLTVTF